MRVLVLGGDGMLGHRLLKSWAERHELGAAFRRASSEYDSGIAPPGVARFFEVDARRSDDTARVLGTFAPHAVVNAVGIVKQRDSASDAIPSLEVNALFPHRLAELCRIARARLVHLSTDCVFSGGRGMYTERDNPDPVDLYGRTKLLGEVGAPSCLTLRTSIIGLELSRKTGLIEWYLAQRGPIRGYRRAIYSGFTTSEMARAIEAILLRAPDLSGVWHLASEPISKYELLRALTERLGRKDVEVRPDDALVCDRSLDATALRARLDYQVPAWSAMLDGLAREIAERTEA